MVAEGENDEIEDAPPNVPFATGPLVTEGGPTTGGVNVNIHTSSTRANVTQHDVNLRDVYPIAEDISPVERSSISSGVPSVLQNEMQNYIRMRVSEAEQEAIREFIESKSLRNIPTIQGNSSGKIAAYAAEPVVNTPKVVETRTIHRSYMKDIPAGVLSSIQKNCINKQPLKRALLRDIHIQLQSCGLLTMLLGQRTRPEYSDQNPTGYREPYTVAPNYNSSTDDNGSVASDKSEGQVEAINLLNGLSKDRILIPADNLELWQHDEGKLLVLVREMFHSRHYPFAETEFRKGLPVPYYNKLYDHVFSKLAVDLDYHESCLLRFSPNHAVDFVVDYQRWNDIMYEISLCTGNPIPETKQQAFLDLHYTDDPRNYIAGALNYARNSHMNYDQTIKAMCEADDRASKHKTPVHTKSVASSKTDSPNNKSEIKYCNKYQTGDCQRGDQCRYQHVIRPGGAATKTVVKQVLNEALVKPVTSKHRSSPQGGTYKDDPDWAPVIGTPAGRAGPGNPYAYSKSQRANIKFMKANKPGPSSSSSSSSQPKQDARAQQPFTSWSDETQPGFKNIHARSLRMGKRKHDDDHISDIESISEQDEEKPQRSLAAETIVDDVNEYNNQRPLSPDITYNEPRDYEPIVSNSPLVYIRDIDGVYNTWNNGQISAMLKRRDSVISICPYNSYLISAYHYCFDYYVDSPLVRTYVRNDANVSILPSNFMYKRRIAENEYSHELKMFGFFPNSQSYVNHKRQDVIKCHHGFMKCIYHIGQIAFGAVITMTKENHDFPNFSIDNLSYIPVEMDGHYHSQQYDIHDYTKLMASICEMDYKHNDTTNQVYTDMLLLALMWDFQVWVAQVLSSVHFSVVGVAFLRQLIVEDIANNNSKILTHLDIKNVLIFFAMNVSPFYNPTTVIYCNSRYMNKYENQFRNGTRIQFLDAVNVRQSTNIATVFLQVFQTAHINSVKSHSQRFIIDTGASVSATSQQGILTNVIPCNDMVAYPAFGPQIQPSLRGEFGKFALDTVVIDNMPDTLISVSQLCEGGNTQKQNVAIFTTEGVRVFEFDSIRTALKMIDSTGIEVLRGFTEEGIYVAQNNTNVSNVHNLYMAKFRPISMYDHVHMITGHPGERGMKWHRENSLNGKYTDNDLNRNRGVCQGCVYGGAHQTPTDPYRDHRPIPLIPGQCFTLDAYTHTTRSSRGHLYCDIFTDLATRRHYPVFTKDRSAHELCEKTRQLFIQHPEWTMNASRSQERFIRLDSESNYKSIEFLTFASSIGYILEHTPVRDKHAGGIAERAVGVISAKTNVAMMAPVPPVPQPFWDYAMTYACDTHSYNYCSAIGTSPYMKITGKPVNLKYLQPFWASCYVYIPLKDRYKIGDSRAYKAHFVGYANTTLLFPNYVIIPVSDNNNYMRHKDSKDVIFDPTINFTVYTDDEEPYDREFVNTDHYIPFLERVNAPDTLRGPNATPNITDESDVHTPILPVRGIINNDSNTMKQCANNDTEPTLNEYNIPYDDNNGSPVYWYQLHVKNYEYPLAMCETQNFYKIQTVKDPLIPQNFYKAMKQPLWEAAIDKELTKFEKNMCLQVVPYNGQHMVPMMWTFVIKTDGTKKARLVGRGDLMIPNVDFDPNAVYCGNVTACSIKICVSIAAVYKLNMKGGDLEGAYLVTRANPDYPVYIKTPQGYNVPKGMCIQAIGNLYGFPPAGQNFSIEFDKCVFECGYKNTPWDLKFFYKWKNNKPMLLIVHSDDFRWFGDSSEEEEWKLLVDTFEKHKYKVSDVTDSEFVGIQITHDEKHNYYMNQTRMIDEIVSEAQMKQAKDAKLPYPLQGEALSKLDNASEKNYEECQRFPYRRIVGQLMYGMVHTLVTIAYALNVLSRYGNNPGPRHIEFLKHLLKYVRSTKTDRLKFITHDGPQDIETMTKILQLRFQCDADLAGNLDTKHSQTSYLGYLGESLICWCSTDQGSMSTSTAESEMKAVNHTLKCEVIANRGILNQMGWLQQPTVIEEDNKACVDASVVPHMTRGMRHLDITQNFLKEKFADGTCVLKKIDSKNNNADIGTKRLPFPIFDYLTYPLVDRSLRPQKKYDKEE